MSLAEPIASQGALVDVSQLTFDAHSLNSTDVLSALYDCGVALVRGLIPHDIVAEMRRETCEYFKALESGPDTHTKWFFSTFGNVLLEHLAAYGDGAIVYALQFLTKSALADVLYDYLDTNRITTPLGYDFVRKHAGSDQKSLSPFHQDSVAVPVGTRLLTCWVPMDDCGLESPGFEVVTKRIDDEFPISETPHTNHETSEIDESVVRHAVQGRLWHPVFRTGDVLVFDGLTVHRSFVRPSMTKVRHSVELRFFDRSRTSGEWRDARHDHSFMQFERRQCN